MALRGSSRPRAWLPTPPPQPACSLTVSPRYEPIRACGNTTVELASLAASPPHLALTVLHASLLYCTNGRTPKRRRHDGEQVHGHKAHMTEDVSKLCEELTSKEDWHGHTRLRTTICSKGAQNYVGMLPGFPLVSHNVSGINWSFHVPLNTARGSR